MCENCGCESSDCDCGCTCDCHAHHHEGHFERRYQTKEEKIAELEAYLKELRLELMAVEEHLADLKK
jgi:hypothetical protein